MKTFKSHLLLALLFLLATLSVAAVGSPQDPVMILAGADLTRVVPPGFYFQGRSAPTQMRNSAAASKGERYVVTGLVDTSGYAADVRAKYEGFLITDSPITIGGSDLASGAYGFGFTDDGKFNILDLAGNEVLSVSSANDSALRRPRPLMMTKADDGVRFYSGRDYVVISFK